MIEFITVYTTQVLVRWRGRSWNGLW